MCVPDVIGALAVWRRDQKKNVISVLGLQRSGTVFWVLRDSSDVHHLPAKSSDYVGYSPRKIVGTLLNAC